MGRPILRFAIGAVLLTGLLLVEAPAPAARASTGQSDGRLSGVDFLTGYRTIGQAASEFQRIRSDGANTVSFDVWWQVPTSSSSTVTPVPGGTDSDADILAAAQEAHNAGLKVTLTPKVVIGSNSGNSGWRGQYNPPDPATFFSNYQTMVDHYASLAQQAGISMFLVGSEMIASDGYAGYWRQVIASARRYFMGPIAYEVDWREIPQFSWGDALDDLLLSAYFPLSNEQYPTLGQLEAGWHAYQYPGQSQTYDAFTTVAGFARRWDKPIIFGEAGYTATTYPANQPWWNAPNPADPALQYLAYRALLDTFVGQPWWGGVLWWAWNDGDPRSPESKPAESLIGVQSVNAGGGPGLAPSAWTPGTSLPGPSPHAVTRPAPSGGSPSSDGAGSAAGSGPGAASGTGFLGPAAVGSSTADGSDKASSGPSKPVESGLVALRQVPSTANGAAAGLAMAVLALASAAVLLICDVLRSRTGSAAPLRALTSSRRRRG
jgi:hypothetical protein